MSTCLEDEKKWETLFEKIQHNEDVVDNFRTLRNWCSERDSNRIECQVIVSHCFTEGTHLLQNNFVAWQFIANATVSTCNCQVFRNYLEVVEDFVQHSDEKTINAIYMCVHNCFKHFNDFEMSDKLISGIIDNIHVEFPLIVAEDIVKAPGKFHGSKLEEFLQIITNHCIVHPLISTQFMDHVVQVFKTNVDDVLKSKIQTESIALTQSATEFLANVAPHHPQLQNDKSLLTSVIYLLKMMEESECCQPKRSMEDLKKMGEQDGVVNMKCDIVKLITSLCDKNFSNQNLVHECGLVPVILDNMRYDARNPFIREACIRCVQVLCENNQSVQQFISQLTVLS